MSQARELSLPFLQRALIASNHDDYVDKSVALANDLARLSQIRASLRDRMRTTSLGDAKRYVSQLEAAYRQAWAGRAGRAAT